MLLFFIVAIGGGAWKGFVPLRGRTFSDTNSINLFYYETI